MPTLKEIVSDIIKNVQGGVFSSDSKFTVPYITELIHQNRAVIFRKIYSVSRRIDATWTQQFYPEYSQDIQESDCFVKFEVPPSVVLDDQTDGFIYIGTTDRNCAFRKLQSRAELAVYNNHRVTKDNNKITAIYSDGFLEVYSDPLLKKIMIDGVFLDPTKIPTYNIELDNYPIDGANLIQLKQLVLQTSMDEEGKTPANFKQQQVDITAIK